MTVGGPRAGKQARISAYNASPPGKGAIGRIPFTSPRPYDILSELRKRLTCSLQENVMVQATTAQPTKAIGVAGNIEGKIDQSCGSKQEGLVTLSCY